MNYILDRCGPAKLEVLGIVNPHGAFTPSRDLPISAVTTSNSLLPRIVAAEDDTFNTQVILYARPHPDQLQYLSLEPISLRLEDGDSRAAHGIPHFGDVDAAEKEEGEKQAELVQKLRLHTVKRFPLTEKELTISLIISQINCSLDIDAVLQRNIGLVRPRSRRAMSVSERVVESATNLWDYVLIVSWHVWSIWIYPVLRQSFILVLMAHRIAGESILLLARQPIGLQKTTLKDVSATAQQVDLRLQQFYYWPVQYLTLRDRKDNWQCISNNHAEYIRFYNSLWLVVNDAIMGIAFGTYVIDNAPFVAAQVNTLLGAWSLEGLRRIISWLMVYPGGLKLNNELARFLGDLFIWVIDYWGGTIVYHGRHTGLWLIIAGFVAAFQPHLPSLVRFIGVASFAGATMPLSIASDLLSLCTVHIYCFYVASARIYGWQLTIISSLFHLFRGKKRNVLRNRIDSCDYELDQLLLGTILFTLLTFLLPTVMVFYLTFTVARMAIVGLKAALDLMLAFLNHFPLFALMLRVKDPWRLPGKVSWNRY